MVQEWFDKHNNEFEALPWPPYTLDLNQIDYLRNVAGKQVLLTCNLKDLLLKSQNTFRGFHTFMG